MWCAGALTHSWSSLEALRLPYRSDPAFQWWSSIPCASRSFHWVYAFVALNEVHQVFLGAFQAFLKQLLSSSDLVLMSSQRMSRFLLTSHISLIIWENKPVSIMAPSDLNPFALKYQCKISSRGWMLFVLKLYGKICFLAAGVQGTSCSSSKELPMPQ